LNAGLFDELYFAKHGLNNALFLFQTFQSEIDVDVKG
jgi:hypothetical protein